METFTYAKEFQEITVRMCYLFLGNLMDIHAPIAYNLCSLNNSVRTPGGGIPCRPGTAINECLLSKILNWVLESVFNPLLQSYQLLNPG